MPIPGPIPGYACQILLDDGTGTFPYDVTTYAREVEGFNWLRGRADELSDNQPGALTLTFDNTDGRFTVGNATYNVACDQRIRLIYAPGTPSQRTRWTGAVQSWPVAWPTGDDTLSTVTATATDPLATLARRTLGSEILEEQTIDGALAFYAVDEPKASTSARDALGKQAALAILGSAGNVAFGSASGLRDVNGAKFTGGTKTYLDSTVVSGAGITTLHFDVVLSGGSGIPDGTVLLSIGGATLTYHFSLGNGFIQFDGPTTGQAFAPTIAPNYLNDAAVYVVSVQAGPAGSVMWVNGVKGSVGAAMTDTIASGAEVKLGPPNVFAGGAFLTYSLFGYGSGVFADARMAAHQSAMLNEFSGETVAARLTRVASYAGVTIGTVSTAGYTTLGPTGQTGRTALDVNQEAAAADLGSAFVNGSGGLGYVSGTDLASKVTADATVDASFCDPSTFFPVDMTSVVNYATGTSGGTGNTVGPVQDAVSINGDATHRAHGVYPQNYAWNVDSDAQSLALTQWKVGVYAQPTPRCPTLKIDLLTMGDIAVRDKLLGLDLGSFLKVTGLPSQTPGGTTANLIVEGLKETVMIPLHGEAEWSLELNCAQRSLWDAFIPDDPVHGIPDSTAARAYI